MNLLRSCCALFFLYSTSCSNPRPVVLAESSENVTLLPDSSLGRIEHLQTVYVNGEALFASYDRDRAEEIFFDAAGAETLRVHFRLPDTLTGRAAQLYVRALNPDTIFIYVPGDSRTVLQLNRQGAVCRIYSAETPLTDGSTAYALVSLRQSPLLFAQKQLLVICARTDLVVRTAEARRKYFTTLPFIAIPAGPGKQANVGCWPAEYLAGESFRDFYPQGCVNAGGQAVFGFAASDSLFVLENGKIVGAYSCRSDHMSERHPYPDDSLDHFSWLQRFEVTEPRYRALVYDPFRRYYYRVVHHALDYERPDGMTVNSYLDKPWSLMVLDENFNLLGETVFDPARFIPSAFPVKNGVLIWQRQPDNAHAPAKFTLFELKFQFK